MQAVARRTAARPRSCDAGLWMNLLVAVLPLLLLIVTLFTIYSLLTEGRRGRA